MDRDTCNGFRYDGSARGHYESYFQRANHPSRPLAFWLRYTVFSPAGRPADAVGELWAVWFDGEEGRVVAAKEVLPFARCALWPHGLRVRLGDATLDERSLAGQASCLGHSLSWRLEYSSPEAPLLLLSPGLYRGPFPKAKALVGSPLARFRGEVVVDGERHTVDDWVGSQNHNWGEKHTDEYAWAQVAGFDESPDSFLEVARGRLRLGPIWTPWLTPAVLRHGGHEYAFNGLLTAVRAQGRYGPFTFHFRTRSAEATLEGRVHAAPQAFVGLPYDNPPGGRKTCLNTKLAGAEVTLTPRGGAPVRLTTRHRAAFEILTDAHDHGVPVLGV